MGRIWNLKMPERREKSYVRESYRTDTVFTFCSYKNMALLFAKKENTKTRFQDLYARMLLQAGLTTLCPLAEYERAVCQEYHHKDCHPDQSPEDIYAFVQKMRLAHFGLDTLKKGRELQRSRGCDFDPAKGIDQRKEKRSLMGESKKLLFLLCDASLFSLMEEDLQQAAEMGKEIVILHSAAGAGDLPGKSELVNWLGEGYTYAEASADGIATDPEDAALLFYGEEGLLQCRSLTVDAVVSAIPVGYHAQALCNLLGKPAPCTVYIPRGTDITPFVPIVSPTRLTYNHLARLCRDHGEGIYRLSCEELYEKYPSYFVNIYDNSGKHLPLVLPRGGMKDFDQNREKAVKDFLNSFSNLCYRSSFFEEEKILVHSVRVKKAKAAQVIACAEGVTPRETLSQMTGTAVVSNFLFFMTEKLGILYNDLREDRPPEQADAAAGHLDYMLLKQKDKRVETFPLFCKTCIAGTENGNFLFFSYGLGGGQITVDGQTLRWEKDSVNPKTPGDICVYTPMLTCFDADADRETYKLPVGAGRVNIVILKERVTCIRRGDVILPSVGVVVSLTEEKAEKLLRNRKALGDGYFDVSDISLTVLLDGPEDIDPAVWKTVQWAYGGGMGLIRDGLALSDGDPEAWFTREGWMSPLSRQTQESALHKLAKHPRTAIGTTENGDLVVLVFSGRSSRSTGADYIEMIRIARLMYPDIRNLMNVDGGGSAVLGMVHDGSFMELSCPATSRGSCVGMVRPINTIFYLPAEKEEKI